MKYKYGAIPTEYKGIRFRSRTEARWAAFFDGVGWRWEYEPYDMAGWIPDFSLFIEEEPMESLVEVKPASSVDELRAYASSKQLASAPEGTVLLGSAPFWGDHPSGCYDVLGVAISHSADALDSASESERALLLAFDRLHLMRHGRFPGEISRQEFAAAYQVPFGQVVGTEALGVPTMSRCARVAWANAQNATQWKGRR
jgi:hypothetical protein